MPKLRDVCHHVRSKNAGPYWITVDLFFPDAEALARYADASSLSSAAVGSLFQVDAERVKRFPVPSLAVLKISFPRRAPQGGTIERDMHGGQQYVRMLDLYLD
jgi:hypothetical protein